MTKVRHLLFLLVIIMQSACVSTEPAPVTYIAPPDPSVYAKYNCEELTYAQNYAKELLRNVSTDHPNDGRIYTVMYESQVLGYTNAITQRGCPVLSQGDASLTATYKNGQEDTSLCFASYQKINAPDVVGILTEGWQGGPMSANPARSILPEFISYLATIGFNERLDPMTCSTAGPNQTCSAQLIDLGTFSTLSYMAMVSCSTPEFANIEKARQGLLSVSPALQPSTWRPRSGSAIQPMAFETKPKAAYPVASATANTGAPAAATPVKPATSTEQPEAASRGWLGVHFSNKTTISPKLASALGMKSPQGVLVTGTSEGGAASLAGLKALDVILAADGKEFLEPDALRAYISTLKAGHALKLRLWQNPSEKTLSVVLSATATPSTVAEGAPGYCYGEVPSNKYGGLSWRTFIFPVSSTSPAALTAESKRLGEQFRAYLLQYVTGTEVGPAGFAICNESAGNVNMILQADIKADKGGLREATGSESVDLAWRPSSN